MKLTLAFVVIVLAGSYAEPPRYRTRLQQQQSEQNKDQQPSALYPPTGFRPSGQKFTLPTRQFESLQSQPPRTISDPPTTEEENSSTTAEYSSTTLESESSQLQEEKVSKEQVNKEDNEKEILDDGIQVEQIEKTQNKPLDRNEGIYYILLSNGQLQKVPYLTTLNSDQNIAYSTELRYENVQPVQGPIYTYFYTRFPTFTNYVLN